jgi:hypothetical protein
VGREHAEHLATVIASKYKMTTDWTGQLYCGITLHWDYIKRTVLLSMPGYVAKALQRFEIPTPTRPQHAPSPYTEPVYGHQVQLAPEPDQSEPLNPKEITRLQEIIGVFLYYGRAIENNMLVALGSLAAAQSEGTLATAKASVHLLNYMLPVILMPAPYSTPATCAFTSTVTHPISPNPKLVLVLVEFSSSAPNLPPTLTHQRHHLMDPSTL